ncbi:hypothetical protein AGIG_G2061 [Arapaima gigas]
MNAGRHGIAPARCNKINTLQDSSSPTAPPMFICSCPTMYSSRQLCLQGAMVTGCLLKSSVTAPLSDVLKPKCSDISSHL